jgi:hypothetical protein
MAIQEYVVWTRYEHPNGKTIIRHAYGPYTKSVATRIKKEFLEEAKEEKVTDRVECSVIKLFREEGE